MNRSSPFGVHPLARMGSAGVLGALLLCFGTGEAQMSSDSSSRRAPGGRMGIEITALYGWQFGGSVDLTTGGTIHSEDSDAFGFLLSVPVQTPETMIELSYSYQATSISQQDYWETGGRTHLFDMGTHYFQVGGLRGVRRDKVMPFGYGTMGATMFDPQSGDLGTEWRFSMTLGVGAKVYASERMGLRAQVGMLLPFQWSGGSLWCGGGGCTGSVSGGTTIVQGNVSGGLVYTF